MADFLPVSNITVASRTFFLLIGIGSTAFISANFAFPYILTFCLSLPKYFASPLYLFITLNFIILIIWKLDRNPISMADDDVVVNKEILSADNDNNPKSVMISPTVSEPAETSMGKSLDHPEPSSSQILAIAVDIVNNSTKSNSEQHPWPPLEPVHEESNESSEADNYSPSSCPDSIDATWWAIMSSKASTIKKQLKKSDTWEKTNTTHDVSRQDRPASPPVLTRALVVDRRELKKSDTFRDRAAAAPAAAGALIVDKREMRKSKTFTETTTRTSAVNNSASAGWRGRDVLVVGSDELFRKVEAFLKMNYDQMRVKRQEPGLHRPVEMMNTAY